MQGIHNKTGQTIQRISLVLCGFEPGDRIPTVSELERTCSSSRGNVQKALAYLKECGAIGMTPHGKNGTLLTSIDYALLSQAYGTQYLVGVMPLPYTPRYEGLATSLFTLLNTDDIRAFITFQRGSEARVQSVVNELASYCVMSRLAFEDYAARDLALEAVADFGPLSYVGRHALLTRDGKREDWTGARVAVDVSSADQRILTERYFGDFDVEYVPVQYTQIVDMLNGGELDAGIWNEDDALVRKSGLSVDRIGFDGDSDNTHAVIVTRKDDVITKRLVHLLVSKEKVLDTQRRVMGGEIPPRY